MYVAAGMLPTAPEADAQTTEPKPVVIRVTNEKDHHYFIRFNKIHVGEFFDGF